jgi:hypothetical protein
VAIPIPPELLMAALGGAQGGTGGALPQFLEVAPYLFRNKYDKYNKAELEALMGKKARGDLGITGTDKSVIHESFVQPGLNAIERSAPAQNLTQATDYGADLYANLARAAAKGSQIGQLSGQAATVIRGLDEAKREAQLQEIEDRTKYQSDRRQQQLAAGLSILTAGIGGANAEMQFGKLVGPETASSTMPGITTPVAAPEGAPSWAAPSDPEMVELLKSLGIAF